MQFIFRGVPFIIVGLFLVAPVPAQDKDKPNPIEEEVKAALKDPSKPFAMIVSVKIKDGTATKFEAAFAKGRAGSRKEKGNLTYEMSRSAKSPNEYIVYERWKNFEALQAHFKEPHFTTMIAEVGELLDGHPTVKVYIPVGE